MKNTNNHNHLTDQQKIVLEFIDNFSTFFNNWDYEKYKEFRKLFTMGFCWHFAKMLQATFNRGDVCIAFPIGHFVWVDTDGVAYDIDGVDITNCDCYIPEQYLKDELINFKHIPGESIQSSTNDILIKIYKSYCIDNNIN